MNKILSFFIVLTLLSCVNQNKIDIPKNFIKTEIPEVSSKKWYELNYSNDDYSVENRNGNLIVNKIEPKYGTELNIENGKLVGTNGGEWGGELFFVPNDKNVEKQKIKAGNIVKIFSFQNRIYFIEGLAHLSFNEGALFQIELNKDKFNYKKILDFEDAPEAIETYENKIFIASYQSFYEIKNLEKKKIFEKQFWASLYPNSIAIFDEENVFIGMRSGIAKLNLKNKTVDFYREEKK